MSLGRFLSQDITEAVEHRSAGKVVDFLSDPIPSGKKKDTQQGTDQADEEDQEAPIKDTEPTPEETGTEEPKESPDNPDNNIMTTLTKPSETVSEFLETYKPNEMTNIEGILPEENYKDLPTLEQAIQNKIPENYEVVLNKFYPYILDINAHSGKYDISFDALYYLGLGGLGGKYVTWQLGRETLSEEEKHKRDFHNCHCDVNHGQTFQINDILNHSIEYANEHGFDPPAPMFGMAGHLGCNCSLQFSKSANFTDETSIQDDCPGLPSNGTDEDKRSMKKAIFDSIPEMVYVNYRTFPPLYITEKTAKAHHMNTRYGSIEVVTEEAVNKPVEIVKNSIAVLPFGFWVPVNADWVGFATKMSQDFIEVFLPELMFKVKVRKKCVKYLDAFDETGSPADKDTTFVMVNGKLGILCYYLKDIPHVYFPDMDKIIKVDQVIPVTVQGLAS